MNIDLRLGDCLEVLKTIPSNSVDAVITDPPYGLSFMGKKWDYDVPSVAVWVECLRVLKPGGHLLSFAGSRTYHRMGVAIEDAGFEIRDQIMWVYAQGFPKSHNIGKAIDKIEGNEREVVGEKKNKINLNATKEGDKSFYENAWQNKDYVDLPITKGNSDWEGWGTALKPAHEPIVMARKPLSEKSIAENVLKHGTGGINIDGSRIGTEERQNQQKNFANGNGGVYKETNSSKDEFVDVNGRFPANIIFNEEAGQLLGEPSRFFYCPKAAKKDRNEGLESFTPKTDRQKGHGLDRICGTCGTSMLKPEDCNCEEPDWITPPKLNHHPTVKPTDLMRYLITLITPPQGVVLDPFMGSGSTGKAAVRCGVNFIGIEKEEDYMDIAKARIEHEKNKPIQGKLL